MSISKSNILKELRKTEAIAAGLLERCHKIRTLVEEEVSTSPEARRLTTVGADAVARRRARKR